MRTATAPELAVLAGTVYKVTPRLKVANGSGTMIDVTTWMERWKIDHDIDRPVSELMIEFRRDHGSTQSLAPLRGDSTLNRDDAAAYSPLLDIGRRITFELATTTVAATPAGSDFKLLFDGNEDVINWEHSPVSVSARDKGGLLVDRWIETIRRYGSVAGIPIATVKQQLLDNEFGIGVVPLVTIGSPAYSISPGFGQQVESMMDAQQALDQLRGWDTRYRYDEASGTFKLTFYEPPRGKTTPDYTFGPSQYFDVTSLFIDRTNIRNVIAGSYYDAATKSRKVVTVQDATSATRYGRQFFKIQEADGSPIDTGAEMTAMITQALADLKDPKAEFEVELPMFWIIDLHDLLRFSSNGIHFNSNQDWAVTSFTHEGSQNHYRTRVKVRGSPAGAYLNWLGRTSGTGLPQPDTANSLLDFKITAETDTTVTYSWTLGGEAVEVWAGQVLFPVPVPANPWDQVLAAVAPLALGTLSLTFTKPDESHVLYVQVEPRNADLTPGRVQRLVVNSAPTQAPIVELDDIESNTVGTQWWKLTERGLAVIDVKVQTQVGIEPITAFVAPTRGPGGASVVRGGTLGALEYEHDVSLDATRFSWIMPQVTLDNGQPPIILGPFGFDRDKRPNIISVTLNTIAAAQYGTVVSAIGDSDTQSIKVESGSWSHHVDGQSISTDVSLSDPDGTAGLGSAATATYTATAYTDSIAEIDGATLSDTRDIQVSGPTAAAPGSVWNTVTLSAPPIGSQIASIFLKASAAPGGYNVKVYISVAIHSGIPPTVDHTVDLTPALSAPPTALTQYDYDVGSLFERTATGSPCTMKIKCDLRNASNIVVDTRSVQAGWKHTP